MNYQNYLNPKMPNPKPSEPVKRGRSPIWGRPASTYTDQHLDRAEPNYKCDPKQQISNAHLNVSQNWQARESPLDSIVSQLTGCGQEKPMCTIRQTPQPSTYIYKPPLLPIKEYPYLEEFAVRDWVDAERTTKGAIVKEYSLTAETDKNQRL